MSQTTIDFSDTIKSIGVVNKTVMELSALVVEMSQKISDLSMRLAALESENKNSIDILNQKIEDVKVISGSRFHKRDVNNREVKASKLTTTTIDSQ